MTETLDPEFQQLIHDRGPVVVFLPNTNELQRFVWAGAFDELARVHQLHFVLPEADADKMMAAAPQITPENSTRLTIAKDRFTVWVELFNAGCVHYAGLSPSFALRAQLPPDPDWRANWQMPAKLRGELDREFDARAAAIVAGLAPLPELLELLRQINPVFCIVPTSLLDAFCNDAVWACEAADTTCLVLQSGWDNMSSKGLLHWRTPLVGTWGQQSYEHALVIQRLHRKRAAPIGAPHYEFLRQAAPADVAALRARLGAAPDERLVLFGGSFRQFDETATLQQLDDAIAAGRLGRTRIVYRPHPWRAARQHEDSFFNQTWRHVVFDPDVQDRYQREQAEAGFIKRNVPMFDMVYLSTLLSAVDAVISPMSTLLLEALIMGKPTMAIAFTDGKHDYNPSVTAQMTHFADLKEHPALYWCDRPDALVAMGARLLEGAPAGSAEARQALIDHVVTTRPGTYAQRLAEFCRAIVEPEGRKRRAHRTAAQRDTISHAYGAHLIAREYCGMADRAVSVPDYWMHGWIPSYHNVHYALIALHKKEGQHAEYDFEAQIREEKEQTVQWVSREDQAEFLREHGYQHVRAIGLPIVYMPPADVPRVPGTLLVLPPHSHKSHGPDDPIAEQYAEMIAGLRDRFRHIAVGLNEDDLAKLQWVESFRRRGIEVFVTTDQANPNTLVRLRRILSTFEYVTTNGYGSHIALAAYCGAKVSIWGPYAEFPYDRIRVTHAVKMFPELLDQAYGLCTEQALREHYGFLFVEPDQAVQRIEWAAAEVGEPSRVSPDELVRLFGWSPVPASTSVIAADPAPARTIAVAADPAPVHIPAIAAGEVPTRTPGAPLVLVTMAHAAWLRQFAAVIRGLLDAGTDVHLHFDKLHDTVSIDDHALVPHSARGRLSYSLSTADARASTTRAGALRNLLMYARPVYAAASDLRGRVAEQQKDAMSIGRQERALRLFMRMPEALARIVDATLAWREEGRPPNRAAADLITSLEPSCVVATTMLHFGSREVDIIKAAKRRGIPTVFAVASWDNLTNKGRLQSQPGRITVWNEAMRREAIELHGAPPDRVHVIGAPGFDQWFDAAPSVDRATFCQRFGFNVDQPILLYLGSSLSIAGNGERYIAREWMHAVVDRQELRKANMLVRPHPMASAGWSKVAEAGEDGVFRWRGAVIWPVQPSQVTTPVTRAEFFDTLWHADVIVGLNTSAMIEAAILRKPVLTFLEHDQRASQTANLHFQHLVRNGFVTVAETLKEHAQQVADVLAQPQAAAEASDRFVAEFVRPLGRDRVASEELVRLILDEMQWKPVGRAPVSAPSGTAVTA